MRRAGHRLRWRGPREQRRETDGRERAKLGGAPGQLGQAAQAGRTRRIQRFRWIEGVGVSVTHKE
jgi:hypothetical protein